MFQKDLSNVDKQKMPEIIENHRNGYEPVVAALSLFSHEVRKTDRGYLKQQT